MSTNDIQKVIEINFFDSLSRSFLRLEKPVSKLISALTIF